MQYLRLLKVPHFLAKSPELAEYDKAQVYGEIYALLSYFLNCCGSLDLTIKSSDLNGAREIEFGYLMPDNVPDLELFLSTFRYFRFSQSFVSHSSVIHFADQMLRRIVTLPAGNLEMLREDCSFRIPHLSKNKPEFLYNLPIPQPLRFGSTDYRWRNSLTALQAATGSIRFQVRKVQAKPDELRWVGECLNLYLHSYLFRLSPDQLKESSQVYQTILSEENLFSVTIHIAGKAREALKYALMRDTDLEVLTPSPVSEHDPRFENAENEVLDIIRQLQAYWSLDELVQLLSPPLTFQDALPGVTHFLPSPFPQQFVSDTESLEGVIQLGNTTQNKPVTIKRKSLTEHLFVAGSTGAGKSHTIRHILWQLSDQGIPFLVIDPAKTDYRPLMKELGKENRIVTLRDPAHRFNPLIPPDNISLYDHAAIVARMLSLFYPTTPAVYEILLSMLRETYLSSIAKAEGKKAKELKTETLWVTKGRDFATGEGKKIIPSFTQFMDIGTEWLAEFGSDPNNRWLAEFLDHFKRRWKLLEKSAFYYLFTPPNDDKNPYYLFEGDCLIDLSSILDTTESNALFALLIAFLCEKRISDGHRDDLRHVTVIEEAHRVMPVRTKGWGDDVVNSPAEEAANLLGQMLAEIRYLGEGLIIAEQSPSKIIPDVLINTSTKIIHRILYGADKNCLGSSMGLTERETDYLSHLNQGEALVFTTGISQPTQIKVPKSPPKTQK